MLRRYSVLTMLVVALSVMVNGLTTTASAVVPTGISALEANRTKKAQLRPKAGAKRIGAASYRAPKKAVYAVAGGGTGGRGTRARPYRSAQTAVSKAPSGATVVLRGGVYHESVRVPFGKRLRIQPFPREAVWFDGASPVRGWVRSGSVWVVSDWQHIFDNRVSFGEGQDESSRYVDPAHPMAGHPDQVWIDGVELRQVGSEGQVTAGTFFVDRERRRLVIGSDPTGRTVEASTLQKALQIHGEGTTVRGIGVRRYAPHLAAFGAVSAEVDGITLDNVVVKDSATIGVSTWGDRVRLRRVTLTGNGMLGLHADSAPGLRVVRARMERNNDERFKAQPVSGGAKLTDSAGVRVVRSVFHRNTTYGLWFDVSMRDVVVAGNRLTANGEAGLQFELSGHALIADNLIARNRGVGLWLFDSNDVQVWNNTLVKNHRSLQVLQDDRRNPDSRLASSVPWVTSDIDIHNNVFVYGTNFCPVLTQHLSSKWHGEDFDIQSDGNVFHRRSATDPHRFVCWADGAAGTKSFTELKSYRSGTGLDKRSRSFQGRDILRASGKLKRFARKKASSVPLPLPSHVARAVGERAGDRRLGAYLVG